MKNPSIGCGYIGSVLSEEIARTIDFDKLIICDSAKERIIMLFGTTEKTQDHKLATNWHVRIAKYI